MPPRWFTDPTYALAQAMKGTNMPSETMPYPKYESQCHGAPVRFEQHQVVKYFCTQCGEPCIARKKK